MQGRQDDHGEQKMHPNGCRSTPKHAQETRRRPKKGPRGTPRRPQEQPKRVQKANPNRKTKQGPKQDDPKTVLDPLQTSERHFGVTRWGPFGRPNCVQKGAENDPKTKRKIKMQKNGSKTISDPSWSDLEPFWVTILAPQMPKSVGKRTIS